MDRHPHGTGSHDSDDERESGDDVVFGDVSRRRFTQGTAAFGAASFASRSGHALEPDDELDGVEILAPDMGGVTYWETLMFNCLQGLANRDHPQVYAYYPEKSKESWYSEHPVPDKRVFYEWYRSYEHLQFDELSDPYEVFDRLDPLPIDGYVIVDTQAPVTANVAANYASTENLLPVTEDLLASGDVPEHEVVYDLRGDAHGVNFREMTDIEVYQWAFDNQWPNANHARVANVGTPGAANPIDISEYTNGNDTIYLRFDDAVESNGFGARLRSLSVYDGSNQLVSVDPFTAGEDQYLYENDGSKNSGDGHRFVNKEAHWTYEISGVEGADALGMEIDNQYSVKIATAPNGPYEELVRNTTIGVNSTFDRIETNDFFTSNRARDYTVAEGGFFFDLASRAGEGRELKGEILDAMEPQGYVFGWHQGAGEGNHIRQLSEYGQLAIGASTYAANFSFHSRVDIPNATKRFRRHTEKQQVTDGIEDKIYVTFVLSDGDSLNFLARRAQGGQWLLDERGEIPFGWEMTPVLAELGPGILDYFQATATKNDHFTVGPSGMGYFYPEKMPEDLLRGVLSETASYLEETGLSSQTVMSPSEPVNDETANLYADVLGDEITGVMEGYVRRSADTERLYGKKPQRGGDGSERGRIPIRARDATAWLPTAYPAGGESVDALVEDFETLADRRVRRPAFVPIHVPAHSLTITDMVDVIDQLDADIFEVVSPDAFYTLFAQSRPGTVAVNPPQGFAPERQIVRGDETNEITYHLQNFDDEPTDVTVELELTLDEVSGPITTQSDVTLRAKETKAITSTMDVPDVHEGGGRLKYLLDGTDPAISVPIQFLSQIESEWTYEAVNANHRAGQEISDSDALNGTAWQAVAGSDGGKLSTNHVVWYPTRDQEIAGEYVARFRMKVADNSVEEAITRIGVVENVPGTPPQGDFPTVDLAGTDFEASGEYQWFEVPFTLPLTDAPMSESQVQYRVAYAGSTTLTVDQIEVVGQFSED